MLVPCRQSTSPFSRGGKGDGDLLHFAKLAKRSLKCKGEGVRRGIVRFWEGLVWGERFGVAIPPS